MAIKYIKGDATQLQGDGKKLIIHVCNDIGGWGKGFVFAFLLFVVGCAIEYRTHEFDTTIKVTDTKGKPIRNMTINVTICTYCSITPSNNGKSLTRTTDADGNVQFNYTLEDSESSTDYAHINMPDANGYLAINQAFHPVGVERAKQKYTKNYSFLVDSVRTYKLRLQRTTTTVSFFSLGAEAGYRNNQDSVSRNFFSWGGNRGQIDTVFTFQAYANLPFIISGGFIQKPSTGFRVNPQLVHKDSVFLLKI